MRPGRVVHRLLARPVLLGIQGFHRGLHCQRAHRRSSAGATPLDDDPGLVRRGDWRNDLRLRHRRPVHRRLDPALRRQIAAPVAVHRLCGATRCRDGRRGVHRRGHGWRLRAAAEARRAFGERPSTVVRAGPTSANDDVLGQHDQAGAGGVRHAPAQQVRRPGASQRPRLGIRLRPEERRDGCNNSLRHAQRSRGGGSPQ
mmetsp:Transcript_56382/g.145152  ORF Transcript_56382/g.145152 Transcript_56382/m.145152 type:complete len:200 (+) Transcript_56382:718-1317(+)